MQDKLPESATRRRLPLSTPHNYPREARVHQKSLEVLTWSTHRCIPEIGPIVFAWNVASPVG